MLTFEAFPKISRLSREIIVTEKIDGTNAQIIISDDGLEIGAASRNGLIFPGKQTDNFGFARWVQDNKEDLLTLGPGRHFGEWWGGGIQRGYGRLDKVFSLFNVSKWQMEHPACCSVVPRLYTGDFDTAAIVEVINRLRTFGSCAQPGFMKPEGVVIFHTASSTLFKKTLEKDEKPKGT